MNGQAPEIGRPLTLSAQGLTKVYGSRGAAVQRLRAVDLDLVEGELVALLGPAGSRPSLLLNIWARSSGPSLALSYLLVAALSEPSEEEAYYPERRERRSAWASDTVDASVSMALLGWKAGIVAGTSTFGAPEDAIGAPVEATYLPPSTPAVAGYGCQWRKAPRQRDENIALSARHEPTFLLGPTKRGDDDVHVRRLPAPLRK